MTTSATDTIGVVETLKADIGRIRDEVKNLGSDVLHLPKNAVFGDLERSVKSHPLQSLAIAGGVGIILGFLLRR